MPTVAELELALQEAEELANRPAILAQQLAEARAAEAAEQAKRQQALAHYRAHVAPQHDRAEQALQVQRDELERKYLQARCLLDELVAGVKQYDQSAYQYIRERMADELAHAQLVGERVDRRTLAETVIALLRQLSFTEAQKPMVQLVTRSANEERLDLNFNRLERVTMLDGALRGGGRIIREFLDAYLSNLLNKLPDPGQRIASWRQD